MRSPALVMLAGLFIMDLSGCGRKSQEGEFVAFPEGESYSGDAAYDSGQKTTGPQGASVASSYPSDGTINQPLDTNSLEANATQNLQTNQPAPGTCGGMQGEGGCWYLAQEEQSCNDFCEDHYGYSDSTNLIVGNRGNNDICKKIATALAGPIKESTGKQILKQLGQQFLPFLPNLGNAINDYPFETKDVRQDYGGDEDDLQFAYSPGCTIHKGPKNDYAIIVRYTGVDSNPDDGAFGTRRVCACKG